MYKEELVKLLQSQNAWRGEGDKNSSLQGRREPRGIFVGEIDLSNEHLAEVNLSGCFFKGTILRGANLRGAWLSGAYLEDVDFTDADLKGANFLGATFNNVKGADLSESGFEGATYYDKCLKKRVPMRRGVDEETLRWMISMREYPPIQPEVTKELIESKSIEGHTTVIRSEILCMTGDDNSYYVGYVFVTKDHPWWGKPTEALADEIRIHGGVTFAEPAEKELYKVGFDCAHSGSDDSIYSFFCLFDPLQNDESDLTLGEVREEVQSLVRQACTAGMKSPPI